MPNQGAKRLRTLASKLWGASDDEDFQSSSICYDCREKNLEVDGLRAQIKNLKAEKIALQSSVKDLRQKLADVTLQLFDSQKFNTPLGGRPGKCTFPNTCHSWMDDNPHLLDLPRMPEVLQDLEAFDQKREITFNVCAQHAMTASRILQHCEWVVYSLAKNHPAVYKIGITENVVSRWSGKAYSYACDRHEDWQGMVVLFVGGDSLQCALIESFLISRFMGRAGCRNCNPGGESAKAGPGPFFTYVVWRELTPPTNAARVTVGKKRCANPSCFQFLCRVYILRTGD